MSKKLEMIILTTSDGVYLTFMPTVNEQQTSETFLNRRFDSIKIDISNFIEDTLQTSEILGEIDKIDWN